MEKVKGKSCATCKWENEKLNPCIFCININSPLASEWEQKKPKTNADRIRAMTDEELAEKLSSFRCPQKWCFPEDGKNCKSCWLEWLKQECE